MKQSLDSRSCEERKILEHQDQGRTFTEEQLQTKREGLAYVRSDEAALRENCAAPNLLHWIALDYFGSFYPIGGSDRVSGSNLFLMGDQQLVDAALQGLRGAIDREDVPDVKEILRLHKKGRAHGLALPFLAGLAEIERTTPEEDAARWDDGRIRKALAFYYYVMPQRHYRPAWYQRLLATHPEVVAEVYVQFANCELRGGREHVFEFAELAYNSNHAQVAKCASLPLLRAFPIRCKLNQTGNLTYLLWAALQYVDRVSLQELIARKLSRRSMNDAQRVCWLAAGITVSPGKYNDRLKHFVQGRENRIWQLVRFFSPAERMWPSSCDLGVEGLELLIHLVGGGIEIEPLDIQASAKRRVQSRVISSFEKSAECLVENSIQRLAGSPTKESSEALASLLADPALFRWHGILSRAQDTQRIIRRDADYRHPAIEQVCQTLNGGTPANPGDLAALVTDRLNELAIQIRSGNTDDWHQYWNRDPYGRPTEPLPENSCRNALLSDLQQRLCLQGVDASREGSFANDKRADIRVAYRNFQVPVEIKKNSHPKLWSAMRDQLMAQYTSAPETDGYGIYLVFWFGKQDTQPPPSGHRPADAVELKERLEKTLTPAEARKISVCVIDVSKP